LDRRAADRNVRPSLRLDVHHIETQFVFFDDAVYAVVARFADGVSRVFQRAAISHCHQQLHNQPLEESWRTLFHRVEDLARKRFTQFDIAALKLLLRSLE